MSRPAIILKPEQMPADRETALIQGARETRRFGPFAMFLYWEPHYGDVVDGTNGSVTHSFTVDVEGPSAMVNGNRYRLRTLAEADKKIIDLEEVLIIEVGKLAFRIT